MNQSQYKIEFTSLYGTARNSVIQKDPVSARESILSFVKLVRDNTRAQEDVEIRLKHRRFIEKWVAIATLLREKGITDEVLLSFDISLGIQEETKTPEKDEGQKTTDLDIIDTLVTESQGWAADLFDKNKNAVVTIRTNSSTGTGFIVSKKGFILTNEHVVIKEGSNTYHDNITFFLNENQKAHRLSVVVVDKRWDVALCKFDVEQVPSPSAVKRVQDYSSTRQGADVLIIGNGFSMGLAPFTGTIRYTREDKTGNLVYTAPSNPGDSGGPVFNRLGECIGIHKSVTESISINGSSPISTNGLTNATPADEIEILLTHWMKEYNFHL